MDQGTIRGWLEIAYFASGVVLAGVAIAGLVQLLIAKKQLQATHRQVEVAREALELAKNDLVTRSKREAVVLAAQRCELFAADVMPAMQTLMEVCATNEIDLGPWRLNNSRFDETSVADSAKAAAWLTSVLSKEPVREAVIDLSNKCEGFAMYFAKGAADEEIAFPVLGVPFCDFIGAVAPYLVAARLGRADNVSSGTYQNVVALFDCWTERLKKAALEQRARQKRAETNQLDEQLASVRTVRLPVIGTGQPGA